MSSSAQKRTVLGVGKCRTNAAGSSPQKLVTQCSCSNSNSPAQFGAQGTRQADIATSTGCTSLTAAFKQSSVRYFYSQRTRCSPFGAPSLRSSLLTVAPSILLCPWMGKIRRKIGVASLETAVTLLTFKEQMTRASSTWTLKSLCKVCSAKNIAPHFF